MGDAAAGAGGKQAVAEVGLFGSESLFVSFDFTRDALLAASAKYMGELGAGTLTEVPSEVKTYVHELTHYIDYTTTPYGLFLQYCRVMQSRATISIVQALVDAGIPFKMPLLENPPVLTGDVAAEVGPKLSLWLNVEYLVATMHGDSERRLQLEQAFIADQQRFATGKQPLLPPLLDFKQTFFRVQETLAGLIDQLNQQAMADGAKVPIDPAGFDYAALQQEMAMRSERNKIDDADLKVQDAWDLMGSYVSVEALIESAATIAEFWDSPMQFESFVAWLHADVVPELKLYRTCIASALDVIKTQTLPQFVMSYMALCELALYAPVLPQHAALRNKYPDLRQIMPMHRWMEILRVAAHVAPMAGRDDCARYTAEICKALGWVHPLQIIRAALDGPQQASNPLAFVYLAAQRARGQSLGIFLGVNRLLFNNSQDASDWRDLFNFCVLSYTDGVNYHRDKDFLKSMTTRDLNRIGLRCIMLGKNLTLAAPYRGEPTEFVWMTQWLRERFKGLFGMDFPGLRVV